MTIVDREFLGTDADPLSDAAGRLAPLPDAVSAVAAAPPAGLIEMSRRYWSVLVPERRLAVGAVAVFTVSGAFEGTAILMLVPLLAQTGVGSGSGGPFTPLLQEVGAHGRALVWASVVGFVLMSLVAAAARYAGDRAMSLLRSKTEARLRKELTGHLLEMEWSSFLLMRFGDIAGSLMMETSQLGAGLQQFLTGIGSILVTCVYLALAFLLSVRLTLVIVGFALAGLIVLRPMTRRVERHTRGLSTATTSIAGQVTEILGNLKFFRSTGAARRAERLFSEGYDQYAAWFQQTQVSPLTIRLAYDIGALGLIAALLAVSVAGSATLSTSTIVFLGIFMRLSPRVRDVQGALVRARVQLPWLTTWDQRVAAAAAHRKRSSGVAAPTFADALIADDISFTFPGASAKVLDGVSWRLSPGETIAFVGESGAGKTTMLDLVTGLLDTTTGSVDVDGVPLSEIDVEAWQAHIGVVLQESPLFHGTVRQNVVGDREADDERIWECLVAAHARSFVADLPDQLDTLIGERGGRLSGGQRQRLALARALYRQPWLLVLDEATSALDSVSEEIVLDALRGLRGSISMIVVAHRLATIEMADRIYVLDAGQVVQSGSWADLLADQSGKLAQMAAKQGLVAAEI